MTDPPTELDNLDPAPAPRQRQRPPARRKGDVEKGLDYDLKSMPEEYQKGAIAAGARRLARTLDEGGMTPRDEAGHMAQLRQAIVQLHEWAPGSEPGDPTGEAQARSEKTRGLYVA